MNRHPTPSPQAFPDCRGLVFASDFDGTLYFRAKERRIDPRDIEAIRAFREAGGVFGLSTGRSLKGILELAKEFPADVADFYVLASGAYVLTGSGEVIGVRDILRATAAAVWDRFIGRTGIVIQANDTVYTLAEPLPTQIKVESVDQIGGHVYGLSFGTGSPGLAHELADEVNEVFGDELCAYPNASNVDIAPLGCSKGTGLALVRERFGARAVGAIGDSYNDLAMADEADAFYTFATSPEDVVRRACGSVASVAQAIGDFAAGRTMGELR